MSENNFMEQKEPISSNSSLRRIGSTLNALYFAPIIAAIVVTWLTLRWLQPAPRVVYTLSDPITYPFSPNQDAVQQLTVTNTGNSKAEGILIRIFKPILSAKFEKYSQADSPQLFMEKQPIEAKYALLPPDGSFKLFFRVKSPVSSGDKSSINPVDIKVSHQDGFAQDAISASSSSPHWSFIFTIVLVLCQFFFVVWAIWDTLSGMDIEVSNLRDLRQLIENKKPWWKRSNRWQRERMSALRGVARDHFRADTLEDFVEALPVHLIDSVNPDLVSSKDWKEIRDRAHNNIQSRCDHFTYSNSAVEILKLYDEVNRFKAPATIRDATWEFVSKSLQKSIYKRYEDSLYSANLEEIG